MYPHMTSNKAIAHWTAKETKKERRLLGEPCFAISNVSTGNSVTVPRFTVFPNLAVQKIDVRSSVVVMELYSCSQRNFVSIHLDRSSKESSLDIQKKNCIISQGQFQQS